MKDAMTDIDQGLQLILFIGAMAVGGIGVLWLSMRR
jgi:hypothetical protein